MTIKKKPNLYLFPSIAGTDSGYQMAVQSDIEYYKPDSKDCIIYISEHKEKRKKNIIYLHRDNHFFRLLNIISTGHPGFFSGFYLYFFILIKFRKTKFNKIIIGDINFFPLVKYCKYEKLDVRLHNLYLKMRKELDKINFNFRHFRIQYESYIGAKIEKKLAYFAKENEVTLYLITEEESNFINTNFDLHSKILPIKYNLSVQHKSNLSKLAWDNKIIWFGGLSSHKVIGIDYFIDNIYTKIHKRNPNIQFLLFGNGSEKYCNKNLGITGYGFIKEFQFTDFERSVFINPDIIGGGIKLKLFKLYQKNVFCISTALGVEGFPFRDSWEKLNIVPLSEWECFFDKINNK